MSDSFETPLGYFGQEYWSGFPFPPAGDLLDPGLKPASFASPALIGFFTTAPPGKPYKHIYKIKIFWP